MTCKPSPKAHVRGVVSLSITIVAILIALVTPSRSGGQPPTKATTVPTSHDDSLTLFLPSVTYDSGGEGPISVAVADVNGDGRPDLIVANLVCADVSCTGGSVDVLLGNGDGTFQPATGYDSAGLMPGR